MRFFKYFLEYKFALLRKLRIALAKPFVVSINQDLLASFCVLHRKKPQSGQLHFPRILQTNSDHLMAMR